MQSEIEKSHYNRKGRKRSRLAEIRLQQTRRHLLAASMQSIKTALVENNQEH
jgi:hypothetical protein